VRVEQWLSERARVGTFGKPSPGVVRALRWVMRPCVNVFHRPKVEGFENLPPNGAYLLVANHSGAVALAEICSRSSGHGVGSSHGRGSSRRSRSSRGSRGR
jgi:hypothetical protein